MTVQVTPTTTPTPKPTPAPKRTRCTVASQAHGAEVIVSGIDAGGECESLISTFAGGGDYWTRTAGPALPYADQVCLLVDPSGDNVLALDVRDVDSHTIGTAICANLTAGGWLAAAP